MFEVISYLDPDNVHLRNIHGATHSFANAMTGVPAFQAIVLKDLISFLHDPDAEEERQRGKMTVLE